jgi:hypothetical protein
MGMILEKLDFITGEGGIHGSMFSYAVAEHYSVIPQLEGTADGGKKRQKYCKPFTSCEIWSAPNQPEKGFSGIVTTKN